jgi:ABC-2 type transport system permease protein
MLKVALFLVRLFKMPLQWLGVDYPQFEILMRIKLTMDFRSSPSGFQTSTRKKRTFTYQLFTYSLLGLLFGAAAFSIGDLVLSLTIFFSIVMVSLTMTLLSEFTSVLFDQRDNYILLPRPISHRTLLMLRLVHIQFYIGFIALALSLAAGVFMAVKYQGIATIIFFLAVGLSIWITLLFTTFIYLLISKAVNGERFKDFVSYTQIVIAVLIFGAYQLLPRLMDSHILTNVSMSFSWWTYLLPPAWLAALVKLSLLPDLTTPLLVLSCLAILVPAGGAFFLVRFLSKGFGDILADGSTESATPQKTGTLKTRFADKINNLFCISDIEKAGWNLAVATTRRDRKFKQAVYPYFGIMIVFAIVILKPDLTDLAVSLHEKGQFSKYLFIVIVGFSGNAAIMQLPYTDSPEAAWIYRALPLKEYGHVMTGALKAIFSRYYIPVYLLLTIPCVILWGVSIIPQLILSGLGNILIVLLPVLFQKMELPFTRARDMQQKGINSLLALLSMVLMFITAGVVYFTTFLPGWITFLICGSTLGLIVLIFRYIRKSWISQKGWVTL